MTILDQMMDVYLKYKNPDGTCAKLADSLQHTCEWYAKHSVDEVKKLTMIINGLQINSKTWMTRACLAEDENKFLKRQVDANVDVLNELMHYKFRCEELERYAHTSRGGYRNIDVRERESVCS